MTAKLGTIILAKLPDKKRVTIKFQKAHGRSQMKQNIDSIYKSRITII